VADALLADIEDQRLAAGAAGVKARQLAGVAGAQIGAMAAYQRLVQQRQPRQRVQRPDVVAGVETDFRKQRAVVRHLRLRPQQQAAQAFQPQLLQPFRWPVLCIIHAAAHADRRMALELLLQRKQQSGHHHRVQTAGRRRGLRRGRRAGIQDRVHALLPPATDRPPALLAFSITER
jgi:hypothetical protein